MKYLLMICGEDREPSTPRMGIEEWVVEMDGRAVRLLGRALDPPDRGATVRVRDGETLVTDGPFMEGREYIGDVELDARARQWAASEPADSWALLPCVDGVFAGDEIEDGIGREARAWGERLAERGVLAFGQPLASVHAATTARIEAGETVLTDGPFVETREFISGVCVLQGVDRDTVLELAAQFPLAAYHRVEVRRFMD